MYRLRTDDSLRRGSCVAMRRHLNPLLETSSRMTLSSSAVHSVQKIPSDGMLAVGSWPDEESWAVDEPESYGDDSVTGTVVQRALS